ncbi:MAG: gliding motility-associated protein GldE [Bacteroidota bacterium]
MEPEPGNIDQTLLLLSNIPWWPELTIEFLVFILLIWISFLVSGSEVAFFSLKKMDLDELKEDDKKISQRIWRIMSEPDNRTATERLLATILITNNFVNVAAILVATSILRVFGDAFLWSESIRFFLDVVVITSVLLFFGEIIPKVYAARYRMQLLRIVIRPLEILKRIFSPLARLLIKGSSIIDNRVQFKETNASIEDLKHAIELTTDDVADKEEKEILKGIVNFKSIPVKSIMRARVDVIAVDIQTPLSELIPFVDENSYSRLPVYEESLDTVKGILHIKDLLPFLHKEHEVFKLEAVMRPVRFIPESKKIDSLLEEFKRDRLHMAVVVDEYGGTSGIVTLEDIIEEIFGEITEEFDSEDWVYTKMSEDTYIFEGRISLNDVRKIMGLDDEVFEDSRGDSDSLGGLILELHGKIPTVGEEVPYHHFRLHVEGVSKNRITQVKLVQLPKAATEKNDKRES